MRFRLKYHIDSYGPRYSIETFDTRKEAERAKYTVQGFSWTWDVEIIEENTIGQRIQP